jgi:hypothetical protein
LRELRIYEKLCQKSKRIFRNIAAGGKIAMTNFEQRQRVVRQWLDWSREKRLDPEPKNFLAYLELKGYIDVEKMLADSQAQEVM